MSCTLSICIRAFRKGRPVGRARALLDMCG
jgi:hypothetical protein